MFIRVLAAAHAVAFASAWMQAAGLVGPDGILPAGRFFEAARAQLGSGAYAQVPSLCWIFGTGAFLPVLCACGIGLAALAGVFFAEGVWTYIEQQHRWGLGGVWVGVALGLALLIPRGRALRWLGLLVPLALVCEIAFYGAYVNAVG